jgi:hypothetical protein
VTKKDFIPKIKEYLPDAEFTYYGIRGINVFNKDYDLVIIYGRYGLTPVDYECLLRIGISKKIAKQMDDGTMLQADHRPRLLLRPWVPVMIFRDNDLMFGSKPIGIKRIHDYNEHYDLEIDSISSLRKINIELGYPAKRTNVAKEFIKMKRFMDYVLIGKN